MMIMLHPTAGVSKKQGAKNFVFVLSFLRKLHDTFDIGLNPSPSDIAFRARHRHAVYRYLRSSSVDVVIKDMVEKGAASLEYPFDLDRLQQPSAVLATAASIESFAASTRSAYGIPSVPWVDFMRVVLGEVLGSWSANPKRSRNLMILFFEAIALHVYEDTYSRLPPTTRTQAADHVDVRVTFWAAAFLNSLLCPGFESINSKRDKWHTTAVQRHAANSDINAERRALIEKTLSAITRCNTFLPQWRGLVSEFEGLIDRVHDEPVAVDILNRKLQEFEAPDTIEEGHGAKTIAEISNPFGAQFFLELADIILFENLQDAPAVAVVESLPKEAAVVGDRYHVEGLFNQLDAQERELGGASLVEDVDDGVFSAVLYDFLNENEAGLREMQELRARQDEDNRAKILNDEVTQVLNSLCQTVARDAVERERVETEHAIERVIELADEDMAASIVAALLKKMSATRAHTRLAPTRPAPGARVACR